MASYVSFSAEIVPQTTESLIAVLTDLANKKVDEVYLLLSTPGGSVMHGMNLYNVMRSLPFRSEAHLYRYLAEFDFRHNNREMSEWRQITERRNG